MTLYGAADDTSTKTGDDGIVQEAVENHKACREFQGVQDERTREDIKFANADDRNAWQWPRGIYDERTGGDSNLPCLTINNTRAHNDIIINAMSKNGFGVTVRPTGGKASYKSAQVMQNIIRRIEYISNATTQYRKVAEQQVDGGIGYILIETHYVSNKTRDQDIKLKASRDPTGVYLDPWIREPDGSDANFGFVFEDIPRKQFNVKYPKFKGLVGMSPLIGSMANEMGEWLNDKTIRLAKYYRKNQKRDTFVWYEMDDGTGVEKLSSDIKDEAGKEIFNKLLDDIKEKRILGGTRSVQNDEVEWFLIAGDKIIDRGKWAGKYIPICRCVGRELVIDGTLDRKGHTRPLISAQRMINYNASMAVQAVALQPKSPWLAAARAIEGQEGWKTANIDAFSVLLYNDIDDEAEGELQKIPPPERLEPPKPSSAYESGMQSAERQMMMISGQFQAQMGENDTQSAASGKAIGERKEQGDIATYHFVEHMWDMKRLIGEQLLDLIPKIYDNKRTMQILGDDGEKHWIRIDPDQNEAIKELEDEKEDEEAIALAFNPTIGEYECVSDPGPDFATRRQEGWDAMKMILQANKELSAVCADLLFKFGDFEGSEELYERLKKEIKATKPYLFDDKLDPQMQALQEQNKRLVALNTELMQKLAAEELRRKGREEKRDIDAKNSDTGLLKVQLEYLTKVMLTPAQREQMQHELEKGFHEHVYGMIQQANEADLNPPATNGSGQ